MMRWPLLYLETYKRNNFAISRHHGIALRNIQLQIRPSKMQVETKYCEIIDKDTNRNVNSKIKLDECINSIAENEGYVTYDVNKKKISTDGGNYLGVLFEIDIKGKTRHGYKETAIFGKTMNPDPVDMGFVSLHNVYKTELFVYKELMKVINEIQDEANIPINERFHTVKCFDESYEEALFLDNLSRKGFKTWFRMDVVTLEMAEASIKQLARFHGSSFALREKRPDFFNNNIKNIKSPFKYCKEWDEFVEKFYKIGLNNLKDVLKSKVGDKLKKVLLKYKEYNENISEKFCLCHGDYRPNNILIREQDGVVVDAVPVDYQLIYYNCPLLDFFYFTAMATDYQFRKKHLTHLKNLYYESLDLFLQNFDISAESVFPRKVFENMYVDKYDCVLMATFLFCPFLFVAEDGDIPDVTKECVRDIEFDFDDRFKLRLNDVVQEYIDMGYL